MKKTSTCLALILSVAIYSQTCSLTCNGNVDSTSITTTVTLTNANNVPCWYTTSTDNKIEVWANGYNGISSYSGIHFLEVNGSQHNTIYQNFNATANANFSVSFAHRARGNANTIDSIEVLVGPNSGPYTSLGKFGDGSNAWVYRTLDFTLPSNANGLYTIRFKSLYVGFGNPGIGNFLDAVSLCSKSNSLTCEQTCNGNVDSTSITTTVTLTNANNVPCWYTTSTDNKIEVWANGYNGISSYSGIHFLEVNGSQHNTIYQNFNATANANFSVSFAHRARGNANTIDSIEVLVGPNSGPYTSLGKFGDGSNAWVYRTLDFTLPSNASGVYTIRFKSLYAGFGNPAIGNFLDAVNLCRKNRSDVSGVNSNNFNNNAIINISPNPTNGKITIRDFLQGQTFDSNQILIKSINGKELKFHYYVDNNDVIIDLTDLPNGTYFITTLKNNQSYTNKIILVK